MAKYLVTGGAGFIGSHITEKLISEGHEVTIFDDFSNGNYRVSKANIIRETILNKDALRRQMKEVEVVFHQAAIVSVPYSINNPKETHLINYIGTKNVMEASIEQNVKKVIFASSAAIYGDSKNKVKEEDSEISKPLSPYGETKKNAETMLFELATKSDANTKVTALRYFNVYGPRNKSGVVAIFTNMIKERKSAIIYGDGSASRDYIYIDDVVDANLAAINKANNQAVNIGSGYDATVLEIWNKLQKITNVKIDPVFKNKREGDIEFSSPILKRAKKFLNFEAKVKLDEGLQKTWKAAQIK